MNLTTGFDRDALLREMIETATPIERVLIAYDHLEVLLGVAENAMLEQHPAEVNANLQRCQRLLSFLSIALDHESFGAAARIDQIYLYCWRRLVEANIHLDIERLQEVRGYITDLAEAFHRAAAPASV